MNPHGPFDGRHGPGGLEESSLSMLPFLGSMLLLLLLVLAALYLWHQGKLPLPKLGGHRSPEEEAKAILKKAVAAVKENKWKALDMFNKGEGFAVSADDPKQTST